MSASLGREGQSSSTRGADPCIDLSVLIISYQTRERTRGCLQALTETVLRSRFEVIVVDNASSDGTVAMIEAEFPQVHLVCLAENVGFAAGVNEAARHASGAHLLLLNPDTVAHEAAIDNLVDFAKRNPEYGICGGRTVSLHGILDPRSCWAEPTLWSTFCFATMLSSIFRRTRVFDPESLGRWPRNTVREVGVVSGCLLLVSRSLWQALDGFDTRFFMYGEDVDLCVRAKAMGKRSAITPAATVTHVGGASSGSHTHKMILVMSGKVTFARKHWHGLRGRVAVRLLWLGVALRAGVAYPLRLCGFRHGSSWNHIWNVRSTWRYGYPPVPSDRTTERMF